MERHDEKLFTFYSTFSVSVEGMCVVDVTCNCKLTQTKLWIDGLLGRVKTS